MGKVKGDNTAGLYSSIKPTTFDSVIVGGPVRKTPVNSENSFYINYTDSKGKKKTFTFALLPLVDPIGGKQSGIPGGRIGPETSVQMKVASFSVPGCGYITQPVGLKALSRTLVGAFIGNESQQEAFNKNAKPSLDNIYGTSVKGGKEAWTTDDKKSAYAQSELFIREVVMSGKVVEVVINSDTKYTYKGVIVNFRKFDVRANQTYYNIELLETR